MTYKTIVVALDLTEESTVVIEKAKALLGPDGRLFLLHVIAPMPLAFAGELMMEQPIVQEEQLGLARKHMAQVALPFAIPAENCLVEWGDAQHEIHRVAAEQQADLIVIGSHGRHGLALLFGSTANAVLHGAGCDVLAVRLNPES